MKKYVKNPVIVSAEQWTGEEKQKNSLLAKGIILDPAESPARDGSCLVNTMSGVVVCLLEDWIVVDLEDGNTVCSKDDFETIYKAYKAGDVEPVKI